MKLNGKVNKMKADYDFYFNALEESENFEFCNILKMEFEIIE